jgi:hypothetical protein
MVTIHLSLSACVCANLSLRILIKALPVGAQFESSELKMVVKGEDPRYSFPAHQNEGDAVSKTDMLISKLLE